MHLRGTLCFFVTLFSLTQVKEASAGCDITSVTSPTASSLIVKWSTFPGATNYVLEVKAVNSSTASVSIPPLAPSTVEKLVQGLRPGHIYQVTFKVFLLSYVTCISSQMAQTLPATSQIIFSKAISSTSIRFDWSSAQGADKYFLMVEGTFHSETHNLTFTTLNGQVNNLRNNTAYNCYVYSSNAAGIGAKSLVKTIRTLVQPPDGVSVSELTSSMARVSWFSVPGVLLYQVSVTASNKPGTGPVLRNVTSTAVNISSLEPCSTYTIGVASVNMFLEPGDPKNISYTTATISTVSSISVEYSCTTAMASVSWVAVFGAMSYRAVITDGQGQSLNCTSTGTACQIPMLNCGELYSVRIIAIANCESSSDGSYIFETAPCPPKKPRLFRECSSNVIVFSWNATNSTAYYHALAIDSGDHVTDCITVDTSCYFTDTVCGESYRFYVKSIYSGGLDCDSGNTEEVVVNTAPCLPQNVRTTTNCNNIGSAVTSWDGPEGAQTYTVEARGNRRDFYNCTSQNTSCTLTGLECGESLSVWIVSTDGDCTTDPVLGEVADTVPCIPQNVSAVETCSSDTASITWLSSNGAIFYIGMATHADGTVHTCTAMMTECSFQNLKCGETYDAFVLATNLQCNSSESQHVLLQTAPCAPVSVEVSRDCAGNRATVIWQSLQAGGLYTAVLQGEHGVMVNCSTSFNNCTVDLLCGVNYNVTVSKNDGHCRSQLSTPIQIQPAPCDPQNVTTVLQCDTNAAIVTWAASAGANGYTAIATDGQQQRLASCHTMGTSCQLTSLPCGMRLNVTVQADGASCNSSSQPKTAVVTAPCIPTHVTAALNCTSNIASITWDSALGATWYSVKAEGSQGYKASCNNTITRCDIPNLPCGQQYSITVMGRNGDCMSPASQPTTLVSAPCPNTGIQARLDCRTNSALISWTPGNGTVSSNATLQSFQDAQKHSCFTNGSSCNISSLQCGQHYNISVTGYGQNCSTCSKPLVTLDTAPCVPTQVNVSISCGSETASVSWAASSGLVSNYIVTAEGDNGITHTCNSSSTSCNISGLACGQAYNVSVTAMSVDCTGQRSEVRRVKTAPCVPQNVSANVTCSSNIAKVTWASSQGAELYSVTASSVNGLSANCTSASTSCDLLTLTCGQSYTITVKAKGSNCSSGNSAPVQVQTVPCVPGHVQGRVNCTTGDVSVSWDRSVGAVSYTAVAWSSGGYASTCNSTGTACVFSDLLCGMNYSLAVSASDSSCRTAPTQPVVLNTVSCKPQNASALLNCDTNSAVVTWELTDNLTHHTVQAVGSDGHRINCTSSDHSCTLSGIHCGQRYNLTVTAMDGVCDNSNTYLTLQSGPCAPSNVQTSLLCDINNGSVVSVSWVQANGAEAFMAVAVSNDGHSYSCNTTTFSCNLKELQCGQNYNVSVYSMASGCGGVKSTMSQVQTAPCPPHNVSANVQCDSGSVLVSWSPAVDASQFRVEMESEITGVISSCNSTNTQCSIAHVPCGESFNISVVALRGSCQSQASSSFNITSAPCAPQGVNGTVDCVTNSAWVSWEVDKGVESYTVLAVGDDGLNTTCSSANSTCNVPDLGCGKSYTFQVTASNGACLSPPSNSLQLETAPCALSSIVVVAECQSSVIMVQWQRARRGNSLYIVTAEDQDRAFISCNSSTSSCNLTNVQCGKEYTIIVAASANQCSSLRSPPYKIRTAPCQPSQVQAYADCESKAVFVSWEPSYVAQSYLLTAVSRDGDLKTCNTSYNNCTLTDMQCSNTYNVSVLASNENCTSVPSTNVTFKTVPCAPTNVTANIQCGNSSASLSWVGSTGAVAYVGIAQSENASKVYCQNTETSCSLMGLVCGTVYNFTVQATDGTCNSSLSKPQIGGAAPCPPAGLRVVPRTVVNDTQILRASWSTVSCPNSEYLFGLKGSIQGNSQALFDLASYWTSRTFFEMPLPCGSSYSATIRARNSAASSAESVAVTGTTVPCAPLNVTFSASSAVVAWQESLFATNYTAYGVTSSGRMKLCMTSQLLCSITSFSSGHIVVTAHNAAGQSEDSVPVLVTAVRRR